MSSKATFWKQNKKMFPKSKSRNTGTSKSAFIQGLYPSLNLQVIALCNLSKLSIVQCVMSGGAKNVQLKQKCFGRVRLEVTTISQGSSGTCNSPPASPKGNTFLSPSLYRKTWHSALYLIEDHLHIHDGIVCPVIARHKNDRSAVVNMVTRSVLKYSR